MNNAFSAYKRQSVVTLTPGEVVVRLYQECEKQLNLASHYIPLKNYAEVNNALIKAQDIVNALRSCLDMKIPISKELDSIYDFFNREILQANIKKDKEKVDSLIPLVGELREAFAQINGMSKEERAQQSAAPAAQTQLPTA